MKLIGQFAWTCLQRLCCCRWRVTFGPCRYGPQQLALWTLSETCTRPETNGTLSQSVPRNITPEAINTRNIYGQMAACSASTALAPDCGVHKPPTEIVTRVCHQEQCPLKQ